MSMKLYVGNLSFGTTEADLHQLFSQVGTVDSAQMVTDRDTGRSRGFAFVEMSSKSEGDAAAAAKLFDAYGIHFDPMLRDEVLERVDALKLPAYTGFVMPKLTPVIDSSGKITDVTISYPQDLTKQMLEYSSLTR